MFAFVLFAVWFCFGCCLLHSARSGGSAALVPVLPAGPCCAWVAGAAGLSRSCCLARSRSGRALSGSALAARVAALRSRGVLL
jgi:hypothetical protein